MRIKNSHLFSFIYLLIFSYCGYRIAILWWVVCAFSVILHRFQVLNYGYFVKLM